MIEFETKWRLSAPKYLGLINRNKGMYIALQDVVSGWRKSPAECESLLTTSKYLVELERNGEFDLPVVGFIIQLETRGKNQTSWLQAIHDINNKGLYTLPLRLEFANPDRSALHEKAIRGFY